ncbi:homoserine dehydrogenase [Candidatus Nitronereus thalassa]|uniref:Homoserine dehydrogenase n=1 Tax=Candidatus Nitronereus thalassa TaxID=3020898 RepID=A0ABU3K7H3_9BACT|nr:homoserine dehydrogenase [Candidatus Nitronereus thalassa]MDT7042298.1 homoserine dehydrogenase [Candidatus Nitronereus thalassa]
MKSQINIGLVGLGTVGTGTAKILLENRDVIARRVGVPLELKRIVDLDVTTDRGLTLPSGVLSSDLPGLLNDPSIDIIIELIGGYDTAKRVMLDAMAQGKHIVTANKALLAVHGEDVFAAAARAGVDVGFEASVGGGIPIIRSLTEGLAANRCVSIVGIMNGTANYILTQMLKENQEFEESLAQAQAAGYAEADPTFDIQGIDSLHKLAIMVSLAYGTPVNVKDVFTEGIQKVTSLDIQYASEFGMVVKLLGIARLHEGAVEARVHPTLIDNHSPLAQVNGVYNAIHVVGDAVGDVMLYGQGAGALPTGSAVVSDVIDIARNIQRQASGRVPPTSFPLDQRTPIRIRPMEELTTRYYLRCMVLDQPGVLSKIAGVLGHHGISIMSVIQQGRQKGQTVPLIIMTHRASERSVQTALQEINQMSSVVSQPTTLIRVEDDGR